MKKSILKKIVIAAMAMSMIIGGSAVSFAGENDVVKENSQVSIESGDLEDPGISTFSNKHRTVKEYVKTRAGVKYNTADIKKATKKCVWTEEQYKVYQKVIGSNVKHFRYNEYRWSWKGYKKVGGTWKYVKSKSGVTRDQVNASDIYSFLTTF